jgi:hypothetical protein
MILYKKKGKIACLKTNSRDKTTRPKLSKKKGKVNIYQDLHRTFYQSSLALAGSVLIISLILTTANMSEIKVYDNMVYFIFLGKSLEASQKTTYHVVISISAPPVHLQFQDGNGSRAFVTIPE